MNSRMVQGLCGLVTRLPREQAQQELLRMRAGVRVGGTLEWRSWHDASQGAYVAWTESRVPEASATVLRHDSDSRFTLVSGELVVADAQFNTEGRRGGDPSKWTDWSSGDAAEMAKSLNGRFHGLAVNSSTRSITLFNDRWGLRRLYYFDSGDSFYFAADATAILAARPELRRLDPRSLGEYITCGCVLGNRTIFDGLAVLPPASAWTLSVGQVTRSSYFQSAEWENQEALEHESYYEEFRDTFARILPRHFDDDIAVSLTGGLDSRMIMAWQRRPRGSLPCYSFGSVYRDCEDVRIARKVAAACGQSHNLITLGEKFLAGFAGFAERSVALTDGTAGVVHAPDLYLNHHAREIAPIRMTGNYGGEVMRRVRAFKPVRPVAGLYVPEIAIHIERAEATYADSVNGHPLSFAVFRQAPWHHYGLLALEETQVGMRAPFLDNSLVRTVFRAPESACSGPEIGLRLIRDGNARLVEIRTDRGLAGRSGAFRSALARRYLDLTAKAEYAYSDGMPNWLAQVDNRLSSMHLERLFYGRHKFSHFRYWYKGRLAGYVQDMLLNPMAMQRPYLNSVVARHVVSSHLRGFGNYTASIHQMISLELIHQLFVD